MSDNNQNNPSPEEQQLQGIKDIRGKLMTLSGFTIAMRSEFTDDLKELKRQNQRYLYSIQNRAELYFYITVILFFISFCEQKLEVSLLSIALFSDQNILEFFKSIII